MRSWIKPADIALTVILLLAAVALTVFTAGKKPGAKAVVSVEGRTVQVLDLETPGRYSVHGPLGDTSIEVGDGGVRIVSSPCPHKLCVRMGVARMRGQVLLCVPNRVAVRIEGGTGKGVDGVAG